MTAAKNFILNEIPKALEKLTEDTPAKFGIMTPQHMVEHLSALFYLGRKEIGLPCVTPEDKLPEKRAFLNTNQPFWKNMKGIGIPEDGLMDLRFANLEEAKAKFISSIGAFYKFHEENPGTKILHPLFGKIGVELWDRFNYKHSIHHLQQFGLIEEDYVIEAA